jgi:hypothetical protein
MKHYLGFVWNFINVDFVLPINTVSWLEASINNVPYLKTYRDIFQKHISDTAQTNLCDMQATQHKHAYEILNFRVQGDSD